MTRPRRCPSSCRCGGHSKASWGFRNGVGRAGPGQVHDAVVGGILSTRKLSAHAARGLRGRKSVLHRPGRAAAAAPGDDGHLSLLHAAQGRARHAGHPTHPGVLGARPALHLKRDGRLPDPGLGRHQALGVRKPLIPRGLNQRLMPKEGAKILLGQIFIILVDIIGK